MKLKTYNKNIVKSNNLVEKQNILNEISVRMTLQEARIFGVYLSKINPRDTSTRIVKFRLADLIAIINIDKINIWKIRETTNNLLSIVLNIPNKKNGYDAFQLFKKCRVYKDSATREWFFEIDAHDEALPLMFDFRKKYFTYQVGNILRLNSSNQMRMYEILKQFEKAGERIISIDQLKSYLGIKATEYPRFGDFKTSVLNSSQKALQEHTDIKFTYEPFGKRGKGGKVFNLRFVIAKNEDYVVKLDDLDKTATYFDGYIDMQYETDIKEDGVIKNEILEFMAEACNNEFNTTEMQMLYDLVVKIIPYHPGINRQLEMFDYLKRKYDELKWRASQNEIKNSVGYLKKIIEIDISL